VPRQPQAAPESEKQARLASAKRDAINSLATMSRLSWQLQGFDLRILEAILTLLAVQSRQIDMASTQAQFAAAQAQLQAQAAAASATQHQLNLELTQVRRQLDEARQELVRVQEVQAIARNEERLEMRFQEPYSPYIPRVGTRSHTGSDDGSHGAGGVQKARKKQLSFKK
jgi:hypothetical protein